MVFRTKTKELQSQYMGHSELHQWVYWGNTNDDYIKQSYRRIDSRGNQVSGLRLR